ncbi:MAG TPA: S24 family peptidase [Candidatus Paceibacterota bacterium]|nr:S24 family peptidase [Candidatus Paceibacterota bacterium]
MPKKKPLSLISASQKITDFFQKSGRMPGVTDIMKIFKYKSRNSAFYLLEKLIDARLMSKDKQGRLLVPDNEVKTLLDQLPLISGMIPAGFAAPIEGELSDMLSISDYLIRNREASYILRVKGDSMRDAGIEEGDMVVFERTPDAKPGDIVVALTDDGYTLKYLRKEAASKQYPKSRYFLEPANSDYPKIYPKEGQVVGVVVSTFRKYK